MCVGCGLLLFHTVVVSEHTAAACLLQTVKQNTGWKTEKVEEEQNRNAWTDLYPVKAS